jgi:hypothetical protein
MFPVWSLLSKIVLDVFGDSVELWRERLTTSQTPTTSRKHYERKGYRSSSFPIIFSLVLRCKWACISQVHVPHDDLRKNL